jgi:hypothetical protein
MSCTSRARVATYASSGRYTKESVSVVYRDVWTTVTTSVRGKTGRLLIWETRGRTFVVHEPHGRAVVWVELSRAHECTPCFAQGSGGAFVRSFQGGVRDSRASSQKLGPDAVFPHAVSHVLKRPNPRELVRGADQIRSFGERDRAYPGSHREQCFLQTGQAYVAGVKGTAG